MCPASPPVEPSRRPQHHFNPIPEIDPSTPLFPANTTWRDTLGMVRSVFHDLQTPWVQDCMLKTATDTDIKAISDDAAYARAFSLYFGCKTIPDLSDGFTATTFHVRLNVPTQVREGVGVGVGVERSKVQDSGAVLFTKPDSFFRYVSNDHNHTQLNLRVHEDMQRMEATFQVHNPDGLWQYCMLELGLPLFLSAFNRQTYHVNFDIINQALLQSLVGGVNHGRIPKIVTNKLFPTKVADNIGQHQITNVLCNYAAARPMMSFPVVADAFWAFNYKASELKSMRDFGLYDRLQRLTITPRQPIPTTTTNNNNSSFIQWFADRRKTSSTLTETPHSQSNNIINNANTPTHSEGSYSLMDITARAELEGIGVPYFRPTSISPTPLVVTPSSPPSPSPFVEFTNIAPLPVPVRTLTAEELRKREEDKKDEERKIRRREAAARSNAKRKREKDLKRLQMLSRNSKGSGN